MMKTEIMDFKSSLTIDVGATSHKSLSPPPHSSPSPLPSPSRRPSIAREPRRVLLDSMPIDMENPRPIEALPDGPLAAFDAVHSRVGNTAIPAVQSFFDDRLFGAPVKPLVLPAMAKTGTRLQRLRNAPSMVGRRPMGVPTDDAITRLKLQASTRTHHDMLGIAIPKERLRQTPMARQALAVRPGFHERALAQDEHLRKLREADDVSRLVYRQHVAEQTRRRMRQVREEGIERTRMQPVIQQYARMGQQHAYSHQHAAYSRDVMAGAGEVAGDLESFDKARAASRHRRRQAGGGGGQSRSRVAVEDY